MPPLAVSYFCVSASRRLKPSQGDRRLSDRVGERGGLGRVVSSYLLSRLVENENRFSIEKESGGQALGNGGLGKRGNRAGTEEITGIRVSGIVVGGV
jgi:hypothetical protein